MIPDKAPPLTFDSENLDEQLFAAFRRLAVATLNDAVSCFMGTTGAKKEKPTLHAEAKAWFESDDRDWPLAFLPICQELGLSYRNVRRQLFDGALGMSVDRAGRARRLVPVTKKDVHAALKEGLPLYQIARRFGADYRTISALATGAKAMQRRKRDKRNAQIRELRAEGMGWGELAALFGMSKWGVRCVCETMPPPSRRAAARAAARENRRAAG